MPMPTTTAQSVQSRDLLHTGQMRVTIDYDTVAAAYDRRYALHDYAGVHAAVLKAIPAKHAALLELGCGTGSQHTVGVQRIRETDRADATFRLASDLTLYSTLARKP
jgi:hypothetical protein